jgi:hypothetical protein
MSLIFDLERQVTIKIHRLAKLNNVIQGYCKNYPNFQYLTYILDTSLTFDLEGHVTTVLPMPDYLSNLSQTVTQTNFEINANFSI